LLESANSFVSRRRAGALISKSLKVSRYPTIWDEIDLAAGGTVPAARMKTAREHRVPLSVAALKINGLARGRAVELASAGKHKSAHANRCAEAKN